MRLVSQTPFPCPYCRNLSAYEYESGESGVDGLRVVGGIVMIVGGGLLSFFTCGLTLLVSLFGIILIAIGLTPKRPDIVRHCAACNYRW